VRTIQRIVEKRFTRKAIGMESASARCCSVLSYSSTSAHSTASPHTGAASLLAATYSSVSSVAKNLR
jgi:hypothetical protein